jgi:hypothetical protein
MEVFPLPTLPIIIVSEPFCVLKLMLCNVGRLLLYNGVGVEEEI